MVSIKARDHKFAQNISYLKAIKCLNQDSHSSQQGHAT